MTEGEGIELIRASMAEINALDGTDDWPMVPLNLMNQRIIDLERKVEALTRNAEKMQKVHGHMVEAVNALTSMMNMRPVKPSNLPPAFDDIFGGWVR